MIPPTAQIDPGAVIGSNVSIGAYSVIGAEVEIGEGTVVGPHVVIEGPTRSGREPKNMRGRPNHGDTLKMLDELLIAVLSDPITKPAATPVRSPPTSEATPPPK